jgi:formate/nitrite transporter FocA (FNT family)
VVHLGSFVDSIITARMTLLGRQYMSFANSIGRTVLSIGEFKTSFTFVQAIALGIM